MLRGLNDGINQGILSFWASFHREFQDQSAKGLQYVGYYIIPSHEEEKIISFAQVSVRESLVLQAQACALSFWNLCLCGYASMLNIKRQNVALNMISRQSAVRRGSVHETQITDYLQNRCDVIKPVVYKDFSTCFSLAYGRADYYKQGQIEK